MAERYDGLTAEQLAARLALPRVLYSPVMASTQDHAHAAAAVGTPSGTLVLTDAQTAGRGRGGRGWHSPPGHGIWLTLVERPRDADAVAVLAIRLGIVLARTLDRFAGESVRLKWPNDLHLSAGKLAGILVEARWRDGRPEWLAAGLGLNVVAPAGIRAAGLSKGTTRLDVLDAVVPAMRAAANSQGALSLAELGAFEARDLAVGRRCTEPGTGVVRGIASSGELLIDAGDGVRAFRAGSLVLTEER